MLEKYIEEQILQNLKLLPTKGQRILAKKLSTYINKDFSRSVFLLKGYAGTGKTSMLNALVKTFGEFKISSVLMAPTGRAAKVMTSYIGQPAYTIHKVIYRQKASTDGMGQFVLGLNKNKDTFFIVDESSMISNRTEGGSSFGTGHLLDDLYEYIYSGQRCKLILVGDTAQLPPVGMDLSPALEANELEQYGLDVDEFELTDVVRQRLDAGILYNATEIRKILSVTNDHFYYFPIKIDSFSDVFRINGSELTDKISECYDRYGEQQTMVITRSNKRANRFNQGIRSTILYKEEQITKGDLLMVVKNNYFWLKEEKKADFIANGDIVEVKSIHGYEELYGFHFANVTLCFFDYDNLEIDCKIILDTMNIETSSMTREDNSKLYYAVAEDYAEIKTKKKRWEKIRENPYFNALQVKFAYAVTCHKAQGGQWQSVFIDQGYLIPDMMTKEYLRWLYTAFTRPVKELYLVNFNKDFFGGEEIP